MPFFSESVDIHLTEQIHNDIKHVSTKTLFIIHKWDSLKHVFLPFENKLKTLFVFENYDTLVYLYISNGII